MRSFLVSIHRYFGLFTAVFLLIASLTGSIISWDHELDEWLNPHFYQSSTISARSPEQVLKLANKLELDYPKLRITFLPLTVEPLRTLNISTEPRVDSATQELYLLDYNQLALNPENSFIQGKRLWGDVSLKRENILPFLYKLHYSLHIPDAWGIELGVFIFGIVAIIWSLDCFIALWISFPNFQQWHKSFAFRWRQGSYKLNFDLHRSGGVWVWIFLLMIAITSVSMNLGQQVTRPIVSLFSTLSPSPFELFAPQALNKPIDPTITREQAVQLATLKAKELKLTDPIGGLFYSSMYGLYGVGFFASGNGHGDGGLGNPWIYINGINGDFISADIPGTGTAGDIFMQAQFPIHSGRIIGITGRIMMTIMGLMVAMLSITGIIIWWRKRRSNLIVKLKRGYAI